MGHMTAKVAVAKAIYAIDRPYDYRVPQELEGRLRPGMRVLVPFGAGNRGSDGIVLALSRELDLLALGDETAFSLGMRPGRYRLAFLMLACLMAGGAIAVMGLVGFVGLLVPHMARLLTGSEGRRFLPLSGVLGAAFLTLCDLAARTLFAPYELPVGILLSALGAPFFLGLLIRRRGA